MSHKIDLFYTSFMPRYPYVIRHNNGDYVGITGMLRDNTKESSGRKLRERTAGALSGIKHDCLDMTVLYAHPGYNFTCPFPSKDPHVSDHQFFTPPGCQSDISDIYAAAIGDWASVLQRDDTVLRFRPRSDDSMFWRLLKTATDHITYISRKHIYNATTFLDNIAKATNLVDLCNCVYESVDTINRTIGSFHPATTNFSKSQRGSVHKDMFDLLNISVTHNKQHGVRAFRECVVNMAKNALLCYLMPIEAIVKFVGSLRDFDKETFKQCLNNSGSIQNTIITIGCTLIDVLFLYMPDSDTLLSYINRDSDVTVSELADLDLLLLGSVDPDEGDLKDVVLYKGGRACNIFEAIGCSGTMAVNVIADAIMAEFHDLYTKIGENITVHTYLINGIHPNAETLKKEVECTQKPEPHILHVHVQKGKRTLEVLKRPDEPRPPRPTKPRPLPRPKELPKPLLPEDQVVLSLEKLAFEPAFEPGLVSVIEKLKDLASRDPVGFEASITTKPEDVEEEAHKPATVGNPPSPLTIDGHPLPDEKSVEYFEHDKLDGQ